MDQTDADALAEKLSQTPEAMLDVLAVEELGGLAHQCDTLIGPWPEARNL